MSDMTAMVELLTERPDMMWSLVADVVKAAKAAEGDRRTGRRPAVSVGSMDELYDVLFPQSTTDDLFPAAFARALGKRSQRQFAGCVGFNQATVSRLITGKTPPTCEMIERIAHTLKIRPTYFREYRAMKLGQVVTDVLMADPRMSADAIKRMGVL